jgi:eukaryotic-like serine/threonine-protein kinase
LRRASLLAGGVALTALAGYLVAALLLFPSPLLSNERQVPRVIGATVEEAEAALRAAGFRAEIADRAPHPTYDAGLVTWQDPSPGVAAPRGSAVALTVSQGALRRIVPDVRGLDADLAQRLLWSAGLTVGSVDTVPGPLPAGVASGTNPRAGDSLTTGSSVRLHVARGPQ